MNNKSHTQRIEVEITEDPAGGPPRFEFRLYFGSKLTKAGRLNGVGRVFVNSLLMYAANIETAEVEEKVAQRRGDLN